MWWDALANYVTALGYGGDDTAYAWWAGQRRARPRDRQGHLRFHAVYWLALLLIRGPAVTHHDLRPRLSRPRRRQNVQEAGNTIDPADLVDPLRRRRVRWWLLRDVARVNDTEFTIDRLIDTANRDLAHGLGNLVSRTRRLAHQRGADPRPPLPGCTALPTRIDAALDEFDFRAATAALCDGIAEANRYLESECPWAHNRAEPGRVRAVLGTLISTCRIIADELTPLRPSWRPAMPHRNRQQSATNPPSLPPARASPTRSVRVRRGLGQPDTRQLNAGARKAQAFGRAAGFEWLACQRREEQRGG